MSNCPNLIDFHCFECKGVEVKIEPIVLNEAPANQLTTRQALFIFFYVYSITFMLLILYGGK